MLLPTLKLALRFTNDILDEEILNNIDTALLDMSRVGIDTTIDDNLIDKCIELYCKWQFDFKGKGDDFHKAYDGLRDAISLCGMYRSDQIE